MNREIKIWAIMGILLAARTAFSQESQPPQNSESCTQEVSGITSIITHPLGKSVKDSGLQVITLNSEYLKRQALLKIVSDNPSCARTAISVQLKDNTLSVNGRFHHPPIQPSNWSWSTPYHAEDYGSYNPKFTVNWSQNRITGFSLK